MSLASASGIIGGLKEYMYSGFKQLPIVLASTSFLFSITTGSIAHTSLFIAFLLLIPLTVVLQKVLGYILTKWAPSSRTSWTREVGDIFQLIPPDEKSGLNAYSPYTKGEGFVPSYWIMSVSLFLGYSIANAYDSMMTPANPSSDPNGLEKRYAQSTIVLVTVVIFTVLLLWIRVSVMRGSEGRGPMGIAISGVFTIIAGLMGWGVYKASRDCGARSSDLFGILSQILPASSTTQNPIVCSAD